MNAIHPDEALATLKSGARPQEQRNLDVIHAVCRELHALGSRDFSQATVRRMSEERNGCPETRFITNPLSIFVHSSVPGADSLANQPRNKPYH